MAPDRPPVPFERRAMVRRLGEQEFDVVVIGGGITGVGVALDAASRGLRTALVERDDLASGTSSKSSKLIHGGLRYLQNGDIKLVYQALRERRRLIDNAPHLVDVLAFIIPVLNRDGVVSRKIARALGSALWMYDLTGGWRIGKRHRRLDAAQVLAHVPTLPADKVAGGYLYFDATADDARLTLVVAETAADHGAVIATRCEVVDVMTDPGGGPGHRVVVEADGDRIEIATRTVVSATGVWADTITGFDQPDAEPSIRPARGVHLTIPWELIGNDVALVIPVPGDRRSLFVVPWIRRADGTFRYAYVGTTDTDHGGDLDEPPCTSDDIDYVLRALNHSFTSGSDRRPIGRDDITAVWSGLRPLVRNASSDRTADLSRNHRVEISPTGIISIAGGKLTTYREMAEDTVDVVVERLGLSRRSYPCRTRRLALHGSRPAVPVDDPDHHLVGRYGTDAERVRRLIDDDPTLAAGIVPGLDYCAAEVVYAVRHEMAMSLIDVVTRRTRAHLLDRAATELAAPEIARLMAGELGWDAAETARQIDDYRRLCDRERAAAEMVESAHP